MKQHIVIKHSTLRVCIRLKWLITHPVQTSHTLLFIHVILSELKHQHDIYSELDLFSSTSILFLTGESLSDQVNQNPPHLITDAEKTVQLNCSHTIKDYYMILWYQQLKGDSALNLIVYVYYTNPTTEDQYTNQFSV